MTEQWPVRLALVGAGIFMRDAHVPALQALSDQFEVVAVYSRTQASADRVAAAFDPPLDTYTDLDALLRRDDIEAVDITVPIPLIADTVKRALSAGKHVVSEKPMAESVAVGRDLLDFYAAHRDRAWMVAENWRYNNTFLKAAELVRGRRIGQPVMCTWTEYVPMDEKNKYYHTPWRQVGGFQGGYIMDAGVHRMAVFRMLFGEVASVSAHVSRLREDLTPHDTISASLRFDNGALGAYAVTYVTGVPWPPMLEVVGDRAALRVGRNAQIDLADGERLVPVDLEPTLDINAELMAFARSVRTGEPHRNTPEEGLQDVALIEAMLRAAETGRAVAPERIVR